MTIRFEHSLSADGSTIEASSTIVVVPSGIPSFRKPIFWTSLASLVLSLSIVEIASLLWPDFGWLAVTPLALYITVPVVFVGTCLGAAWDGKLYAWWKYTEM